MPQEEGASNEDEVSETDQHAGLSRPKPGDRHVLEAQPLARHRAEQVQTTSATGQVSYRSISSTDEARALAGTIVQDPSARAAIPTAVSSTDEARFAAGVAIAASVNSGAESLVLAGIPGHHSPASP